MNSHYHKNCECYEASLRASKKFYCTCTKVIILIGAYLIAYHYDTFYIPVLGGIFLSWVMMVIGQTIENRAYVLAHDEQEKSEQEKTETTTLMGGSEESYK